MNSEKLYTLNVSCPDQPGLIAKFTELIHKQNGNILDLSQHTAVDINHFFLRAEFTLAQTKWESLSQKIGEISRKENINCKLHDHSEIPNIALFVSKTDHCLMELLLKQRDGELNCSFPCIISNHPELEYEAKQFKVPFYLVDNSLTKPEREKQFRNILEEHKIDSIVLARYMQILSGSFVSSWMHKIINIHHGLLPAFKGAKPYHQAWKKGVKLVGATAHYATEDLDMGPIIHQDVRMVHDRMSISDLVKLGKDVERTVLVKALQLHLEHRVFVQEGRTFTL